MKHDIHMIPSFTCLYLISIYLIAKSVPWINSFYCSLQLDFMERHQMLFLQTGTFIWFVSCWEEEFPLKQVSRTWWLASSVCFVVPGRLTISGHSCGLLENKMNLMHTLQKNVPKDTHNFLALKKLASLQDDILLLRVRFNSPVVVSSL